MALDANFLPIALIVVLSLGFFAAERIWPGRPLPRRRGWYTRALILNSAQVATMGLAGLTWNEWFRSLTIVEVGPWAPAPVLGFVYWLALTFVFYWWHRLRHTSGFWQVFHQVHHSPSRIEVLTSFYKHPLEMAVNSMIGGFFLYTLVGASPVVGTWYALFAAAGEHLYHANLRTPRWMRYVVQTPELHSIHHQLDHHDGNFGDITLWDRLFGTYRDTVTFAESCGFASDAERDLVAMLRLSEPRRTRS